jgi:hypothetical protein
VIIGGYSIGGYSIDGYSIGGYWLFFYCQEMLRNLIDICYCFIVVAFLELSLLA